MSNPKISVIIPVYNAESTLRRCVDSVLAQTFTDFECLLINDGSKDKSGEICDEYATRDSRIRVFHQENSGPSAARNLGLTLAEGQYVLFQDADDYLLDNEAYLKLITYAVQNDLDILRFDYSIADKDGNLNMQKSLDKKAHLYGIVFSPAVLVHEAFCGEWFTVLCIIKRTIIGNIRFNLHMTFLEDMDFYARLLASANLRCGYMPEIFYAYCQTDNSLSKSGSDTNFTCSFALCDVFAELADFATDQDLSELYRYNSVMMYYWTLSSISDDPYYERREEILNECGIGDIHNRTLRRIKNVRGICKYWLFIVLRPSWSLSLLRLKTRIVVLLKSL
ncbi:MAG: glycosyltransferase [Bacteroidales bacterium]|nr:glycosyltransferase [Bacteroidales bacterium]